MNDCKSGLPALINLQVGGRAGCFEAWLCPLCVLNIPRCLAVLCKMSGDEIRRLEQADREVARGA